MVDVQFDRPLERFISLREIQDIYEDTPVLKGMPLITRKRLSVQPVSSDAFYHLLSMEHLDQ